MAKGGNSWYKGMSRIVKLILAIIPVTAWIVHAISRITSGRTLNVIIGVICLFGVGLIVWIVDLITTIVAGKLLFN